MASIGVRLVEGHLCGVVALGECRVVFGVGWRWARAGSRGVGGGRARARASMSEIAAAVRDALVFREASNNVSNKAQKNAKREKGWKL